MDKWEYMKRGRLTDCDFDELGEDGWELVAYDFEYRIGIFKRLKPMSIEEWMDRRAMMEKA